MRPGPSRAPDGVVINLGLEFPVVGDPVEMPHYAPILKGRMGELRALGELGNRYENDLTPLVEIPLNVADTESESPDAATVAAEPRKFAET